jgi:hypothetical protein
MGEFGSYAQKMRQEPGSSTVPSLQTCGDIFFILMAMKTVEDPVWMYALGYIQYGCMDVDRSMDRCNLHPYGLLY